MSEQPIAPNPLIPAQQGYVPTKGDLVGISDGPTRSPYAQQVMPVPPLTTGPMQGAMNVAPLNNSAPDVKP